MYIARIKHKCCDEVEVIKNVNYIREFRGGIVYINFVCENEVEELWIELDTVEYIILYDDKYNFVRYFDA